MTKLMNELPISTQIAAFSLIISRLVMVNNPNEKKKQAIRFFSVLVKAISIINFTSEIAPKTINKRKDNSIKRWEIKEI